MRRARGRRLPGVRHLAVRRAEGLRRLFRQAAVSYAHWAAGTDASHSSIGPFSKLVSIDPYYEEGHVLLVEAFEALGEREAARSAYALYQRIVREALHAEPRPSLARRYEGRARAGPTLPREDLVPLREVTLHVVDWPGGEPAVLGIHGSAGSAYSLTALGELLAPRNCFVAVDLRGHGFSDKPPSGYDLPRHVDDITQRHRGHRSSPACGGRLLPRGPGRGSS